MTKKSDTSCKLSLVFNGRNIAIYSQTEWLAELLQRLFCYLISEGTDVEIPLLELYLRKIEDDIYEVEERGQRSEIGSIEYILHHTREWITHAFIAAFPELLWLHAGSTVGNDLAVLLPGPAGAGKSTMAVKLVERGWHYVADDIIPVDPHNNCVLPFPFTPMVRDVLSHQDYDRSALLEHEKTYVGLLPAQICSEPATVGCIIFPEYSTDIRYHKCLERMTVVAATHILITQCVKYDSRREFTIAKLFELARNVPCFRLTYSDPERAVGQIIETVLTT